MFLILLLILIKFHLFNRRYQSIACSKLQLPCLSLSSISSLTLSNPSQIFPDSHSLEKNLYNSTHGRHTTHQAANLALSNVQKHGPKWVNVSLCCHVSGYFLAILSHICFFAEVVFFIFLFAFRFRSHTFRPLLKLFSYIETPVLVWFRHLQFVNRKLAPYNGLISLPVSILFTADISRRIFPRIFPRKCILIKPLEKEE